MWDLSVEACKLSVVACGIQLSGIEPGLPESGTSSPSHQTTREVPLGQFLDVQRQAQMFHFYQSPTKR